VVEVELELEIVELVVVDCVEAVEYVVEVELELEIVELVVVDCVEAVE